MSDLEQKIHNWKAGFTSLPALRQADVEELEQHVRDALPSLILAGLSAEEAFLIATRRVGAPAAIEREFAKVNGSHVWSQRVFWIIVGALGYVVCRLVIGAAASVTQALVAVAGGTGTDMGYAGVAVTCAGWIAVAAALYRRRNRSAQAFTPRRVGLATAGMALTLALAALTAFAAEMALFQLMPIPDAARGTLMSSFAARVAAALVPLVLFTAMMLRMRGHASAAD